jgi:beta-glucosidase
MGYQGDDMSAVDRVAACLKHYIGYGASEAGKDYVYTEISDQTLWDTYLPPYQAGIEAGAATVMSSFNDVSGIPGSAHSYLLTEVLKNRWGHDGFVVSDWGSIGQLINQGVAADNKEAAEKAFTAGVEMDMMNNVYRPHIPTLIEEGKVTLEQVDEAVTRVLRLKFRLGLFDNPFVPVTTEAERYLLPEHLAAAERLAEQSMVLLKNENDVLPLSNPSSIALIGPMVEGDTHLLGSWSFHGKDEDVTGILDGMRAEFDGKSELVVASGSDFDGDDRSGFAAAVRAAENADVVVLCLGEKKSWSGENASRSSIALPTIQQELAAEIAKTGKPIVLVLSSGRPLELGALEPLADAIVEMWQPGVAGGRPIAGILSGRVNPSGKLAVTFPYSTGQIPIYYNHRQSARPWGGQGLYQDIPSTPLYEFGYGLSYSTFEYGDIEIPADSFSLTDKFTASLTVRNASDIDGMETVHWFINDPVCSVSRPVKELKHFEKQLIPVGESRTFSFEIDPLRDLGFVDRNGRRFVEPGDYFIIVGDKRVKLTLTE